MHLFVQYAPHIRFASERPVLYGHHFSSFFDAYEAVLGTCCIYDFSLYLPPECTLKVVGVVLKRPVYNHLSLR